MKTVKFVSSQLPSGKKGILKPDSNGYYELPIGGLNAYNSAGEYYTLNGAEALFSNSALLMRRMGKGVLKSELGHPKKLPGMSDDQYLERIMTIEESNVCAHIKELWLDKNFGSNNPKFNNPNLVAIMAKICPSGPHGDALAKSFANPSENVGFSIRGITNNYYERGKCMRILTNIITFDQVVEWGISVANKWASPSLESLSLKDNFNIAANEIQLEKIIKKCSSVSTESTKEIALDCLNTIRMSKSVSQLPVIPIISRW